MDDARIREVLEACAQALNTADDDRITFHDVRTYPVSNKDGCRITFRDAPVGETGNKFELAMRTEGNDSHQIDRKDPQVGPADPNL